MSPIRFLGASALTLIVLAQPAPAADTLRTAPPTNRPTYPAVAPYSAWAGPYAGLLAGYGWGGGTITSRGWSGGGYAGFNVDIDRNLIVGLEADGLYSNKTGSSGGSTVRNPWNATLRARIGFGAQQWLAYGTAGVAFGGVRATTAGITETATRPGWVVGAGVEAKVGPRLTTRVEYRYTSLRTATFTSNPSITYRSSDVLVGIGVKF